jgi:hypothetical protein
MKNHDVDESREATGGHLQLRAKTARKKIQRTKPRTRFRGVPPPPLFDLSKLADTQLLTQIETAAVIRRAQSTLESWRFYRPDHPLRWRRVGGRIMYQVGVVREFLKGEKW